VVRDVMKAKEGHGEDGEDYQGEVDSGRDQVVVCAAPTVQGNSWLDPSGHYDNPYNIGVVVGTNYSRCAIPIRLLQGA
jgi:hypothetical protein